MQHDGNPQVENGHTDIANEIMEAFAKIRISGEARQVLDFIIRKTYGWKKKSDFISLSQFISGTELKKTTVCRAISKLKQMNLIVTKKDNDIAIRYSFNKFYKLWKPLPKKIMLPKKIITVTKKDNLPLPKKSTTKETITKETITKEKKNIKKKYFDYVFLTDAEYDRLLKDYGKSEIDKQIEALDLYIGSRGKQNHYKDHNRTIRTWLRDKKIPKLDELSKNQRSITTSKDLRENQ